MKNADKLVVERLHRLVEEHEIGGDGWWFSPPWLQFFRDTGSPTWEEDAMEYGRHSYALRKQNKPEKGIVRWPTDIPFRRVPSSLVVRKTVFDHTRWTRANRDGLVFDHHHVSDLGRRLVEADPKTMDGWDPTHTAGRMMICFGKNWFHRIRGNEDKHRHSEMSYVYRALRGNSWVLKLGRTDRGVRSRMREEGFPCDPKDVLLVMPSCTESSWLKLYSPYRLRGREWFRPEMLWMTDFLRYYGHHTIGGELATDDRVSKQHGRYAAWKMFGMPTSDWPAVRDTKPWAPVRHQSVEEEQEAGA